MNDKDTAHPRVGDYTFDEFLDMVAEYRSRWCRNKLAVYPNPWQIKFLGDRRVVYLPDRVRLEEI